MFHNEKINELVLDMARKHAEILENECKLACEKFNVSPDQLIIKYMGNVSIQIDVRASHFQIRNEFKVCGEQAIYTEAEKVDNVGT